MLRTTSVNIPVLGTLKITATDKGVIGINFIKGEVRNKGASTPILNTAVKELKLYASGRLKIFSVPVDLSHVSGFTKLVLEEVREVQYGKTISYKQLASAIGRESASRAVGNSLGKNPVPIIIPCHRVVKTDGSLGGYSSGVAMKKKLLGIEKTKMVKKAWV